VTVWADGQTTPSLHAVDPTYKAGRIGIGSFFDLGSFRNVKISGIVSPAAAGSSEPRP
jgi:hypothetical protein